MNHAAANSCERPKEEKHQFLGPTSVGVTTVLLAPTGALILMMVRDISVAAPAFQIFNQSIGAIDVTSVILGCLNRINAVDVTKC